MDQSHLPEESAAQNLSVLYPLGGDTEFTFGYGLVYQCSGHGPFSTA